MESLRMRQRPQAAPAYSSSRCRAAPVATIHDAAPLHALRVASSAKASDTPAAPVPRSSSGSQRTCVFRKRTGWRATSAKAAPA